MSIFKVSTSQIREIKAEEPKSWPIELTVWVENWNKDWPIPWFVPISLEKKFQKIRMEKRPGPNKRALRDSKQI